MSASAERVEPPPDLGQRQVLGLEPADETQSREVALAVLAARPGLADGRQQPLGEVVADRARGDPGKVREFGQGVAIVVWHVAILTVERSTVNTLSPNRHAASIPAPHPAGSIAVTGIRGGSRHTDKESHRVMPRVIAAILLVVVLVIGGGIIATTAYQAGLSTAVTTATADGATVVAPVVVPAYGYGWAAGIPGSGSSASSSACSSCSSCSG